MIPLRKTWRIKEKYLSLQTRTINVTTMKTSYCHKTSLNDSIRVYAIILFLLCFNLAISAQVKSAEQDSLNIPVILIDGVEVQNLDSIDIVNFKDELPALTLNIFIISLLHFVFIISKKNKKVKTFSL